MTVLNYQVHTNITDHKDWLLKLKDFCLARGWTIDSYQTSVDWVGPAPYSFQAGSEDYLAVSSNGYGSQNLFFRMATQADDADNAWVKIGGHFNNTLDTNSATHPVQQTSWNIYHFVGSFDPTGFPAMWLFGNDKFIMVVTQLDGAYVEYFTFGSLELFDSTETEGNWIGYTRTSTIESQEWNTKNTTNPFDLAGNNIYWGGKLKPAAEAKVNFTLSGSANSFLNVGFASYGQMLVTNNYSEIRPITKQIHYLKDLGDGLWFPFAQTPIYRIRNDTLAIGEKIKYGSDEYLVFPYSRQSEYFNGVAVRIL